MKIRIEIWIIVLSVIFFYIIGSMFNHTFNILNWGGGSTFWLGLCLFIICGIELDNLRRR